MRSRGEGLEDERGRSGAATAARRSDTGGWKPMSLRTRRGLALLATFLFVAAACTTAASPPPQPPAPAPAPPAPPAATSADFKFAVDGEPTYFSVAYTDLPTSWIVGLLYNGMYRINDSLSVVPDIATGMPETSADGLTWTVKLRDDVKLHDGSAVTSADVKFTFDLALSPNCTYIPDFCSSIGDNVESIAAPDATTIVLKLKLKYAPFLIQLASPIMPKAAVEASYAKFAAAAGGADTAAVAALADKISSAALQQGEINWQTEVTSDALATLKGDATLALSEFPDFGYYYIGFNLKEGKLYADKALREAFAMCIDHDQTVSVATEGNGIPIYANVPPASWAFSTDLPAYTYDVPAAKAKIEGA